MEAILMFVIMAQMFEKEKPYWQYWEERRGEEKESWKEEKLREASQEYQLKLKEIGPLNQVQNIIYHSISSQASINVSQCTHIGKCYCKHIVIQERHRKFAGNLREVIDKYKSQTDEVVINHLQEKVNHCERSAQIYQSARQFWRKKNQKKKGEKHISKAERQAEIRKAEADPSTLRYLFKRILIKKAKK